MAGTKPIISVLILAYNSAHFVRDAVDSVLDDSQTGDSQVVILDNGSQDDTFEVLERSYSSVPNVTVTRSDTSLGFAGGNNTAARLARGEILLVLNDDCVLEPGALQGLRDDFAESPDLGICQCALASADGTRWESLGHFLDSWGLLHVAGQGSQRTTQHATSTQIFGAKGAALGVRQAVFDRLGGFDESFGFLFEETDLCWRALLQGFKVTVSGRAVVRHKDMARYMGPYVGREGSAFYMLERNRLRSMLKNFSGRYLVFGLPMHLCLMLSYSVREAWPNRPQAIIDFGRAIWWNMRKLRSTVALRRRIQGTRTVSDGSLVKSGRLYRPNLARMLRHPAVLGNQHSSDTYHVPD
jgi:GT2 family glycosyltransferase